MRIKNISFNRDKVTTNSNGLTKTNYKLRHSQRKIQRTDLELNMEEAMLRYRTVSFNIALARNNTEKICRFVYENIKGPHATFRGG